MYEVLGGLGSKTLSSCLMRKKKLLSVDAKFTLLWYDIQWWVQDFPQVGA